MNLKKNYFLGQTNFLKLSCFSIKEVLVYGNLFLDLFMLINLEKGKAKSNCYSFFFYKKVKLAPPN